MQQRLTDHVKGVRTAREDNRSLLAGLLFGAGGEPLIAVHTNKGKQRYRYYVSKAHQHGTASPSVPALRLPAREIEQVVRREITSLLADPMALIQRCGLDVAPGMLGPITLRCEGITAELEKSGAASLQKLVSRIAIHPDRIEISLAPVGLAELLGVPAGSAAPSAILHVAAGRLTRTGHTVRLVQDNGAAATSGTPDPTLVRLLVKARRWWRELATGDIDITTLSRREGIAASYMTRIVRLTFLAPQVVEGILAGRTRATVDGMALLATGAISGGWDEQVAKFMPDIGA